MLKFITLFITAILLAGNIYVFAANKDDFLLKKPLKNFICFDEKRLPLCPERVVFLTTSSMELWIAAGGADSIVARPTGNLLPEKISSLIPTTSSDLGSSNIISIENVIKHKPDLVVGSAMVNIQQQMEKPLLALGIPMLSIPNYGVADICTELALYGKLIGDSSTAEVEIKRIKDNISNEAKRREGVPKKRVLFVWGTPVSFTVALPSSRQGDILKFAGGENIAKGTGADVKFLPFSLEYAVKANPDCIVFASHGNKERIEQQMKSILSESSSWNTIKAIKEGRYFILPPELFAANPGSRIDEAVVYLSKLLYPENN